jgi:hypothetical protein
MRPTARLLRLRVLVVAALLALVGAGCGDDSGGSVADEEDPEVIVERAFSEPIESADVTLDVDLEVEEGGASESFQAQLTGPCRWNGPDEFASFDYELALQGGGASVPPISLASTGDDLFVRIVGTSYSLGSELLASINSTIEGDSQAAAACGTLGVHTEGPDLPSLMEDLEVAGEQEVAGTPTTHVTGTIAVEEIVTELNSFAREANQLSPGAAPTLSDQEVEQLTDSVDDPRFDLFVGEDGVVRGFNSSLAFGPSGGGDGGGGISSGSVALSVEFAGVGGEQEITAPENPRPLSSLIRQVAGLSELFGGGELTLPDLPGVPGGGGGGGAGGAGGQGGGGDASGGGGAVAPGDVPADVFERYSECLGQADVSDQESLARCNELLAP